MSGQDKIVQYLQEAHAMELALVRTLQAHSAMTPAGTYRGALDAHLRETRVHAGALAGRLRELDRSPRLAKRGYGLAQRLAGQLAALGKAPLDRVRGTSAEEQLLKNAKDECASEALEIATYDALEALARGLGDADTAALAVALRGDEERMLETLSGQLPGLAAAVAAAAVDDVKEGPRSPLPSYDELTVEDVTDSLAELTPAQLHRVATYERAHKRRRGVLDAVERREERAVG